MIGDNLKRIMKIKKISAKELAEELGISKTHLSYIMNNKRNPSFELLDDLCEELDVPMAELVEEESIKEPSSFVKEGNQQHYYDLNSNDERDIQKRIKSILDDLMLENSGFAYYNGDEPMSDEDKELLRISLENTMRLAKQMAKQKFTPKKYRK